MTTIDFAIIGAGWRTEFYLRVARALPERFRVTGVQAHTPEQAEAFGTRWGVRAVTSLDELLADRPAFVVTSVPWAVTPALIRELAERGVVTLAETPPAPDLAAMNALWADVKGARVQVAEQYHLQPQHAARLAVIASGKLGAVMQAQVSAAHGYHGVSLMRRFLGLGFEAATVTARSFATPIVAGPWKESLPAEESIQPSAQTIAYLDFGNKQGVFDFTGDQYFSWIRSERLLIRGERGEINSLDVRFLQDYRTPIHLTLARQDAGRGGNLEGFYHKGYTAGAEWVYTNPLAPGRLSDEEIAVGTCLLKTAEYAGGGDSFYSLPEAFQDHYLGLMIDQAAQSGGTVKADRQSWAG